MKLANIVTPSWCRWDPENPRPLTIWLNLLFACAGGFMSANLYYSHPILDVLAHDFNTTQAGISTIPTLALAGDATGILFVLPLADFFPRRRFTLIMMVVTTLFWLGLCITRNVNVFAALTYLSAVTTGVPQIMMPLVAELSTDSNRASNVSIVATGPTLAILLARILSGVVANYTSWRNVYWLALGLQVSVIVAVWLLMPDYPPTNKQPKRQVVKTYPKIIWSIFMLYGKHPELVQACILVFCTFFTVSSFWTTLTFLLADSPYNYNTFIIGLFGLIGAVTMVLGPIYGKYIVQPLNSPLFSAMIGKLVTLTAIIIGTFVGKFNVAGPVIQAVMLDAGLMILSISNRITIHPCSPNARNRVNTAYIIFLYLGMLSGAKVSNVVYDKAGGWVASGCLSIGVIGFSFLAILARGPHETGWIGWTGGWGLASKKQENLEKSEVDDQKSVEGTDEKVSGAATDMVTPVVEVTNEKV